MLAHEVEEAQFPLPDESGNIENSWAVHQLYTTVDFGRENDLLNFFSGGLNFQVEHHLFPRICHVHYKPLSAIVEETAKEFDLPYLANPSFFGAIGSHIRLLKKLGNPEDKSEMIHDLIFKTNFIRTYFENGHQVTELFIIKIFWEDRSI